ncbi:MAG: transporter [Geobacteraceae bacterium]|nr:transporter [Geobacteraceae bacterium]
MKRHYLRYVTATLLVIWVSCSPASAAEVPRHKQSDFSISLGAEFASGDYGTGTTTESVYLPLILTWFPTERIDIGVELPYIYQNNSNVTTSLFQSNQTTNTAKTVIRQGGPGGSSVTGAASTGTAGSGSSGSSVSGLGDIILRCGVIVLFEGERTPQLRPSLFVKFPTANAEDGLGTGEFDAGGGLEATKWFGDLLLTGEALYNYQGRVSGFGLKNYLSYTAGVGYQATQSIRPMLILKGATAPSSYTGDLLEARLRMIWDVTRTTSLDLFVSHGIADSSPEVGGGAAVVYNF